jgi:hypothetical protein
MSQEKELKRIRGRERVGRLMYIFGTMESGGSMEEAIGKLDGRKKRGKDSEELFDEAMKTVAGVEVRQVSAVEDGCRKIDRKVVTKSPLGESTWKVQIKSSRHGVEGFIEKKRGEYRLNSLEETKKRLAIKGLMVIDAGDGDKDGVRRQFSEWLELARMGRRGS